MTRVARAKKSLAQYWLNSPAVCRLMVGQASRARETKTILEVGPGRGALTVALLAAGWPVVAVEKDEQLVGYLKNRFASEHKNGQLKIIAGDILAVTPAKLGLKNYQVVANLPYYLTGHFLRQWVGVKPQPKQMVLLVQRQVADRLTKLPPQAPGNKLGLAVALYGQPRYLKTVRASSFNPRPRVDSAVVTIEQISRRHLRPLEEEKFFTLLQRGFAQKRKLLKNNLNLGQEVASLEICQIKPRARAEELTLNQWLCLTHRLNIKSK